MRQRRNVILQRVEIVDSAAEGRSVAKVDGKAVFIEKTVPGDVVDVKLTKIKKDWAEGYPLHFHSYSTERVEPFFQHFGVCGGCKWQMLPYERQLTYKQQQVYETLKRIGKIKLPDLLPIAGAEETKFYRNKLEYTFSTKEFTPQPPTGLPLEQKGVLGFHPQGFFDKVVDIDKCWLQPEPTNTLRNIIRTFAQRNNFSFYNQREHRGLLRTMQVRICTTGEIMVNIVFGENDKQKQEQLLSFIKREFPQITALLYTINSKWNDSLNDLEPVTYSGNGYVIERLEDFEFKIGPKSFFQTNTKQAERLYRITREFAELNGSSIVYDLYCGTGSIGIFCSKKTKKIIGIESLDAAVRDAKENAALNNIGHALFFTGDVVDICNHQFLEVQGKPDVLITDPPRAGMHEKLVKRILEIEAPVIVYVSCNPATQARDLNLLDAKYEVAKVQPVDMFPHTHHIENVVQLRIKTKRIS
ncbi:MAG: 23S rRNA (uracil(1939)-C(5))-methyltransferase RlmD [Chitinophagaceae bacterium]|nr:23S rRNA (uracil(1939)-C(5))-methyltransferase RlmD [Chitinophagaceae bacterium]